MQAPSTKSQLRQLIEESHQRQLAQIDALTPAERAATGTPQHWSAKDILAHALYWKERWPSDWRRRRTAGHGGW